MTVGKSTNNKPLNYTFSLTFNPEILRTISYVGLIIILLVGAILTETLVDVDPHTTAIYKLFGFNHPCNWLDHEPSRTVSAMLLPLWEVPFIFYIIFDFLRIQDAYRKKEAPLYLYIVSAIFLPIEILLTVWFRIVFVWSPEVNFLYHYLPYIGFQFLLFLVAFENFLYFYAMKALPFKNSRPLALAYLITLFAVTVGYTVVGISSALGHPILDLVNDPGQRLLVRSLMNFYTFLIIPIPLIVSVWELKRSPNHKLSFE
ncbi:hypothetical protein H6F78_00200 [Coleofasciculus sp. FACHB-64]|uniref:hypothetical protein n=1 Tax=Cyanophyceae TaxID=3028117 RepID=UPI001683A747|nr:MULTISPECIES: hypothetical protein [unclassified Coleofasciculus]MBD1838006.1 hypothetical protein [Coleofasciculus sp. FACHB-501]MBD1944472.1 hypothetical protein [Coleofasciculus sp. FACHB-712]MBD2044068.1 hypothetical protein [Coleofasciculus sp. FACHB-64]